MKNSKKFILIISLCVSLILLSCANGGSAGGENKSGDNSVVNGQADNNDGSNNEKIEETAEIPYDAHLPDMDLAGMEFRILNVDEESFWWSIANVDAESETGDIINDAIYTRNRIVEDKFNFIIKEIRIPSGNISNTISNSVKSGSDDYNLVIPFTYSVGGIASKGILTDLNSLPHIDLKNPWWGKSAVDFSILNKTYFAMSDFILTDKENVSIMMYNKNIAKDLGMLSDMELYALVESGGWTHDKFVDMIKSASADLNGNGVRDVDDRYGLLAIDWGYSALMASTGERFSTKDAGDMPVFTANNPRFISVYGRIMELMNNRDYVIRSGIDFNHLDLWGEVFTNDRALFCQEVLSCVRLFSDMRSDFAVVPLPKLDESQSEYYSYGVWATCLGIPVTVANPENTAIVIEALSSLSRQRVMPAYYEIAIALKYLRDDISFRMLDIILKNVICDPLRMVYDWGSFNSQFQSFAIKGNTDIVSLFEKYEGKINSAIQKTIEAYAELP